MELMKSSAQLFSIAKAASGTDEDTMRGIIAGACLTAAERGDYLCTFDRKEYTVAMFDDMRAMGCAVEWDCGTIYVRWA